MFTLEKIPFVSFEQIFDTYLKTNQPVLLQKKFSNESIFSWTPGKLKERIGNTIVKVNFANKGEYQLDQSKGGFVEQPVYMKFRDFVDQKIDSESYYLQQTSIVDAFPELVDDIPFRELLDPDLINVMNIWIGGAKTVTPLHYDFANNFFIQCYGKKKVVLFESSQTKYLYPYEIQNYRYPYVSQVDIRNPDFEAFPQYRHSDPIEIILNPGDILFLPSTTWHQVESVSISISINIWFRQFDFQYAWPNVVRLIPQRYASLPYLHSITVPYQFSSILEFCDHLLSLNYYFEACISYVALLEHLVRKISLKKNILIVNDRETGQLRNDLRQAIDFNKTLLCNELYDNLDKENILFFLNSGKEMLELNSLNCRPEKAVVFCKDIRSMILKLYD